MAGIRTAGVDWASEAHEVCVSEDGRVAARFSVTHDERGIERLVGRLAAHRVDRVAIERPDGILVERLLAAGLEVLAIHPNQMKAARPRYAVAHGKSDRFDAFVLAELARTDAHRFRALVPDSDETKALRALTRAREDMVEARVALANQLRAQLEAFWPGALIFGRVDSRISLAFIARYPTPADARGLGTKRMAGFLERHGYSGRTDPAVLVERMQAAPAGTAGAAESEARRSVILGLVAGLGSLLAEIGDCRGRYPTEAALAADAGMSPVALESGKLRVATFRRACDKRLRKAVTVLADSTRHWHPWAKDVYQRARDRGQDHPHATRTLGRAWIRVLWRCWQDGVPYDPAQHGSLGSLRTTGG